MPGFADHFGVVDAVAAVLSERPQRVERLRPQFQFSSIPKQPRRFGVKVERSECNVAGGGPHACISPEFDAILTPDRVDYIIAWGQMERLRVAACVTRGGARALFSLVLAAAVFAMPSFAGQPRTVADDLTLAIEPVRNLLQM
jgi:hypothetical protein